MLLLFLLKTVLLGLAILGGSIGFVASLYKAIHFIEEYPSRAKEKITLLIYGVCLMHTLLFLRGFSLVAIAFSLVSQLLFFNLLDSYPQIETAGAGFICAVIMAFLNHMYFLNSMLKQKTGIFEIFFYFFVIVWAVPFTFFLSLTANDETLGIPGGRKPMKRTFAGRVMDRLLSRDKVWEDR
ncbi:hypothetical protein NEDG_01702 [Nematocida displodere]|uniref:Protein TEX261 n=1 Tax=Nematocida displodere TaxID=1805483 RepID=A0A177EGK0_9MICR|nr:hypothetical protein NEDG_01702 [Nematocida displodere]